VKIEIDTRLEAVGSAAWSALHLRSRLCSPFLGWIWQTEWVRAFADGRRLEIWRVSDEAGALVAILPLYEAEPGTFRIVGGTDVSDYLDLLAVEGQEQVAWAALLEARAASPAVWDLHCVPAESPTATALVPLAEPLGLTVTQTREERCPVLALPASWDAYLAGLTGKQRHELTRKMRRLERELPETRVTSLARPDDIDLRIGDFLDLHRRSAAGKARFMDARMEAFFRRAITALATAGVTRLWFLDASEGPLASYLTLEWGRTVGLYNSGFRPDRASLSPGVVLLAHVIRDAIERGGRRFDFLRGEERYKYDLGAVPEDVLTVVVAPGGDHAVPAPEPPAP
jgi:CelD/BcsL family acetyltransferase involved in cellulose biosynthesis